MQSSRAGVALFWSIVLIAGGAACRAAPLADPPAPASHTITIEASEFKPPVVEMKVGDAVTWANRDFFAHNATATGTGDLSFDSGSVAADTSWTFTPSRPGDYRYTCKFHPIMTGVIRVC